MEQQQQYFCVLTHFLMILVYSFHKNSHKKPIKINCLHARKSDKLLNIELILAFGLSAVRVGHS